MPSSIRPDPIPLTPADCFLRALDAEVRRRNGASHNSQLVLHLGPGFDSEGFRETLAAAAHHQPILRAPIRRRFGVGLPAYHVARSVRAPLPPVEVHDDPSEGALERLTSRRLNETFAIRRGELLRFDLLRRGDGGTALVMTWIHMLFDGSGSENFLRWLDECGRGERTPEGLPADEFGADDPSRLGGDSEVGFAERGRRARAWVEHIGSFRQAPPHSLAGPVVRERQALGFEVDTLSAEETEVAVADAARTAGFLTPMLFYLAASIRAHHAVFSARGQDPGSYVLPLPVNTRPRGGEKAVFRTHVSLIWFQVRPEQVGTVGLSGDPDGMDRLVEVLKSQRRDAIKSGMVENGRAAIEFARSAPVRLYSHMARRDFGGELGSFFFAYTGEFLAGVDRFFGAEVENGYHVAPVPASPGSCLALSLRGGRMNCTHTAQRGLFRPGEAELLRAQLRSDLLRGS